jgi:hypothetical protein
MLSNARGVSFVDVGVGVVDVAVDPSVVGDDAACGTRGLIRAGVANVANDPITSKCRKDLVRDIVARSATVAVWLLVAMATVDMRSLRKEGTQKIRERSKGKLMYVAIYDKGATRRPTSRVNLE